MFVPILQTSYCTSVRTPTPDEILFRNLVLNSVTGYQTSRASFYLCEEPETRQNSRPSGCTPNHVIVLSCFYQATHRRHLQSQVW